MKMVFTDDSGNIVRTMDIPDYHHAVLNMMAGATKAYGAQEHTGIVWDDKLYVNDTPTGAFLARKAGITDPVQHEGDQLWPVQL